MAKRGGLVLHRKRGESVIIHDCGEVLMEIILDSPSTAVLRIQSDPEEFDVDRNEIFREKYGKGK